MQQLNLPIYQHRTKVDGNKKLIFDIIRKKYVALTPEEWVRQNFIHYLINEKNYPAPLIAVEMTLKVNTVTRRCDIALYNNTGKPIVIVECKAADVKINQKTFEQIANYNIELKVDYLIVTNGINHYCCKIDYELNTFQFLKDIPDYKEISVT